MQSYRCFLLMSTLHCTSIDSISTPCPSNNGIFLSLFVCWDIRTAYSGCAGGLWQLAPESGGPRLGAAACCPFEFMKLFIDFGHITYLFVSVHQRYCAFHNGAGPCRTFYIELSGFYWEDLPLSECIVSCNLPFSF